MSTLAPHRSGTCNGGYNPSKGAGPSRSDSETTGYCEEIFNFGSGPGVMPAEVLQKAQAEMLDWQGRGISVWELPFTGDDFQSIADRARRDLIDLLAIPDNFKVLFMQGGASAQFSLVPMNLLGVATGSNHKYCADYLDTGYWSQKAILEARRYCSVNIVASGEENGYVEIPPQPQWRLDKNARYCHMTSNETANGLQFPDLPHLPRTSENSDVPLVVDMSSDFLSRPIDFQRVGLVYAGAQKNIGPSGLTIVIIREDLIAEPMATTPSVFSYQRQLESNGRVNTPLTYAIYLAGLVFQHLKERGGLATLESDNRRKSALLYDEIDRNPLYQCPINRTYRSSMNCCFSLNRAELTEPFLQRAKQHGLINLVGHSAVGGIRASLYNAMPERGVQKLVDFMQDFSACRTGG